MKRILSIFLSVIMLFSCVPLTAYAADNHEHNYVTETNKETGVQTTYCKDNSETTFSYDASTQYPESPHNYDNNMDKRYAYGVPGAVSYLVKFSDKCKTEAIYDTITVSNGSGETVGVYSGTELAGKTMLLEGTYFAIDMQTDRSATYYGFSIDTIVVNEEKTSYVVPNILWETEHTYRNNLNQTYNVYVPGANEVNIEFSKIDFEKNYDSLSIYDANGKLIKKYSDRNITGSQLKLHIPSDRFSMVLYSDRSNTQNYYGFKIKSVTGTRTNASTVNPTGDYELLLPSADYPQTRHNYAAKSNLNYGYKYPNAKSLKVKFSDKCKTEEKYDVITIYDENGNKLGTYSGTQLAGKTIDIPTGAFNISFTSDYSKNYYGFSIDSIVATMSSNPETVGSRYSRAYDTPIIPHTSHNYANNADETYYYTDATASSLDLQFYANCLTEANYDFITVYDKNGKQLARYSGKQAANKFLHINGNSFSIKFTSDGSKTYYGYSLFYVSPNYNSAHEGSNVYAYPETSHKYENYAKQTYKYVSPYADAKALDLRFSSQTLTESNYDFITLYDGNGKLVGKYSGSQLAGKTIRVDGNNFKIDFTTDRSACYYGFSFDAITSVFDTDYYEQTELRHNYVQTQTIKENGINHKLYTCTNCGDIQRDVNLDTEGLIIALDKSEFAFDGQEHKPLPVFENGELELTEGVDYTLAYDKDCTTVGEHKVTVNFINKYNGIRELVYVIYPNNIPEITVENTGFGFNVNFAENATYSVVYADNENFENSITVGVAASDKAIISDVEVGKTYYVKVASCVAQNGKLYYSDYCDTQTVYIDGVMGEVSNLSLSKVYVTDMPWAVKATWDAIPNADKYEVFVRCWDYDVVKDETHYNTIDTACRCKFQNMEPYNEENGGCDETYYWTPLANKETYIYPANYVTENIEVGSLNDGGWIVEHLNAHKGIVRPFYTDTQIEEEVKKGDFLNYAYPGQVSEPTISSEKGYYSYDNYYYRYYTTSDGKNGWRLNPMDYAIANSSETLPACGIKYTTTDTEFTTYANLADYHRYTISVRAIKEGNTDYKGEWNTSLIKLDKKPYSSYSDSKIITQSEKDYIVSELLKAESYVKQIWNKNIKFNFYDITKEAQEDLYIQNMIRLGTVNSLVKNFGTGEGDGRNTGAWYWNSVTSNNLNKNYNYSEEVANANSIGMKTDLWGGNGILLSNFDFLDPAFCNKDRLYNEYDVFYTWLEVEGSIRLYVAVLGRGFNAMGTCDTAGAALRNALGLPACDRNCYLCQGVIKANSRI
ncbi:MAG: CUB domain-containing protein [Candidatus Gastranaerophilaceae bacterium]